MSIARWLSVDVVLGALASGGLVCYWLDIHMPLSWWWVLAISVWVIYTLDHLMDAYRLGASAHTARHLFHHRNFSKLSVMWGILFFFCVAIVPFLIPEKLLLFGFAMGGLVILHLGLVKWVGGRISWLLHKELGVGLIYTLGIWGGPCMLNPSCWSFETWGLMGQFFILAMINLLIFSMYELETDKLDDHTSFVRAIGRRRCRWLNIVLGLIHASIGLGLVLGTYNTKLWKIEIIYVFMLTTLLLISENEVFFRPKERYRSLADGVFLFPALIWLV